MTDLVSRDELMELWDEYHPYIAVRAASFDYAIRKLPVVYPKKGKWIDFSDEGYVEYQYCHSATNCDGNKDELHFCYSCGADMRESE